MTRRLAVIFLAAVVGLANSLCACADSSTSAFPQQAGAEPANSHCHADAPTRTAGNGCHSGNSDSDDHGSCGHCTGTVTADVAWAKVVVPPPPPSPLLFVADLPDLLGLQGQLVPHRHDHTGLSPPVASPTLLSLFCSLLN